MQPALGHFAANSPAANTELIIFGAVRPAHPPELGLPVHYANYLQDEISLSLLYAAADLFVAPSTQDNLPNTILEATACGIPSVAFRVGGIPDLIDHMETGYLSEPLDSQDLARGMLWVLADEARRANLSHNARAKAEQDFALTTQTQRYCDLYQELILQQEPNPHVAVRSEIGCQKHVKGTESRVTDAKYKASTSTSLNGSAYHIFGVVECMIPHLV